MLRRAFAIGALVSTIGLAAMAICLIRGHFAYDDFHLLRWNPSTLTYTEMRFDSEAGEILAHLETTTALSSDNTAAIQANVGPSDVRLVHSVWPPTTGSDWPVLWADHYRCTPSVGINVNGLSNCWTLEFRCDTAAAFLALLPACWAVKRIRRLMRGRQPAARGFPVIESPIDTPAGE